MDNIAGTLRRLGMPLVAVLVPCMVWAATLRGSYTDPAGYYVEPGEYYAMHDGIRMPPGNISFENHSTAAGPNVPGRVGVVYSNATTSGHYEFQARNSQGNWRGYDWTYSASGGAGATAQEVWAYPARTLTGPVTLALSSYTGIDSRLTASHGSGPWNSSGSLTVVPFQGSVSYESASFGSDVHVVRGDSVALPYSTGTDLAGWQVWFAAKASPADSAYAIGPLDVTAYVTDPAAGTGLVELSSSDTDLAPRRYFAEVELRNQGQVLTPLRFFLWIDPDVLR